MNTLLTKRDRWGNGYGLWILVAMVFVLPLAWQGLKQIDMENDVTSWLPDDDPEARTLNWFKDNFHQEDRVIVSWDSSNLHDPRVSAFARRLEGETRPDGTTLEGSQYVDAVATPLEALARIVANDVSPADAVARLQGVLVGPGPLRVRLSDVGRKRQVVARKTLIALAQSELDIDIELILREDIDAQQADIDEEQYERMVANLSEAEVEMLQDIPEIADYDFQVEWAGMHLQRDKVVAFEKLARTAQAENDQLVDDCFRQAGTPVAVLVALSEAGREDRKLAFAAIRDTALSVGISADELRLGGRPVAGHEINQYVKKSGWNRTAAIWNLPQRSPILTSMIISLMLALFLLRSVLLTAVVQVSSVYAMCLALSLVPVTGGSMNMVLVVMPTLLLVLTLSAAIHVANYWRHASHSDPTTAVERAVKDAWLPCVLAAITTAIGMLSLATSPLVPVRDFGVYSAVGCVILLAVVLYGLPAMLQYLPAGRILKNSNAGQQRWQAFGNLVIRWRAGITIGCVILFAVGCFCLRYFKTETKVIRYFPQTARIVQDYDFLEENLSGIVPVDTIVRFDAASRQEVNFLERQKIVADVQQAIHDHPEISGALSLATFMADPTRPPESASRFVRMRWNKRAATIEDKIFETNKSAIRRFLARPDDARWLMTPGDGKLNQAGDELWRITAQVAIQSELDYNQLTTDLDTRAATVLRTTPGANHTVTGMVPVFLRTQEAVLQSLIKSFALAFVLIAIVMAIVLRNPIAGMITMLPNLLPVAVVFGLISWLGIAVDIGTMITASVALGIAVDGTLHLLQWFRSRLQAGDSRTEAVRDSMVHCGPALTQTSLVVGIGLLALTQAELLLVSRFGWMMSALIGAALVADLVLLPALLAGPLGRLLEKQTAAQQPAVPAENPHTAIAP